jgi:hypothetical protein
VSDLEHLVSLADMMGGRVAIGRTAGYWVCEARTEYSMLHGSQPLARAEAPTITGAVLLCLQKLRAKETTDAK